GPLGVRGAAVPGPHRALRLHGPHPARPPAAGVRRGDGAHGRALRRPGRGGGSADAVRRSGAVAAARARGLSAGPGRPPRARRGPDARPNWSSTPSVARRRRTVTKRRAEACWSPRVAGPPARAYQLAGRLNDDTVSHTVPSPVRSTTKASSPRSG